VEGNPEKTTLYSPYKVANFFPRIRIARVRIDAKHNIDRVPGDFDAFDEGPDQVTLTGPVC
jgi:hypothetical protein